MSDDYICHGQHIDHGEHCTVSKPTPKGEEWEKEYDEQFIAIESGYVGVNAFGKYALAKNAKTAHKSFIRQLLQKQDEQHAVDIAACKSNYDQMKLDYEGQLQQREREALMKGKLEAYTNTLLWTKQVQPDNKDALIAHGNAVDQMKYEIHDLIAKQKGGK